MRGITAFLVWLSSFWTWKDFFLGPNHLKAPPLYPASGATARGESEPVHNSNEGHSRHELELARFLSNSLPEDECWLEIDGNEVTVCCTPTYNPTFQADTLAVMPAIASSKVTICCERFHLDVLGDDSRQDVGGVIDALGNSFKELALWFQRGSAFRMVKCV